MLLMAFSALVSVSLAVPYTSLSGVLRYEKMADGTVSEKHGSLNSSGEYTVFSNFNYPLAEVTRRGLTETTIGAISGKFVLDASFVDRDLATVEGRERLSNYSFSSNSYNIMDFVRVYIVTANATTPKLPIINISATKSIISEGGLASYIVVKLNRSASEDILMLYTLGGTAKLTSDYTGPRAVRYAVIPRGSISTRIPVRPVNDFAKESIESIVFNLAKSDGYRLGVNRSVTIQIKDND